VNEQIDKLLVKAGAYFGGDGIDYSRFEPNKFAKLIIEDCINIVNKRKDAAIDADWLVDEAMTNAVWDIEEHFYGFYGVEE
jgi:hypothetical protein